MVINRPRILVYVTWKYEHQKAEGFIIISYFNFRNYEIRKLRQQTVFMQLIASAYIIETIKL